MSDSIRKHLWEDIANAPELPGIYAWYYSPEITDYDLEETISELKSCHDDGRPGAEDIVRSTLDSRVFRHFREGPYKVLIDGPLKPTYAGDLEHSFQVSSGLVQRIVEDPDRLRTIRKVLDMSAPMFASPLYMGMAGDLRSRLSVHKSLIERYRMSNRSEDGRTRTSDAGFAWQDRKTEDPAQSSRGIHVHYDSRRRHRGGHREHPQSDILSNTGKKLKWL